MAYNDRQVQVEWDEAKNRQNHSKHGISFEQAQQLFRSNVEHLEIYDEEHSDSEERFLAVGPIPDGVVVIVWTERDEDTVRIISARWATPRETNLYESYLERHLYE